MAVKVVARLEFALMFAEPRVFAFETLLDELTALLGRFAGVPHPLVAQFVRPLTKSLVFTPRAGEQRADQHTGGQTDDSDYHRIFRHIFLEPAAHPAHGL